MCRANMSLWYHIKKDPVHFIGSRPWRSRYFWHDTFGKHYNRLIKCPSIGHHRPQFLHDGGCFGDGRPRWYCFDCEQEVDPGIDDIWEKLEPMK